MPSPIRFDRRAFVADLVLVLPAALAGIRVAARTPTALIAVTPEELLDTLEHMPIRQRFEGMSLEPTPWDDVGADGYENAVGGVEVTGGGNRDEVFGAYIIFEDEQAAQDAVKATEETYATTTVETFPKTIEDHEGVYIAYEQDGYHSLMLIAVQNVLVIGNDSDIRRHAGHGSDHRRGRGRRRGEIRQSIGHAAVLVKHLLSILERPT